jgi:multiple sugar transport system substrate-binding protein
MCGGLEESGMFGGGNSRLGFLDRDQLTGGPRQYRGLGVSSLSEITRLRGRSRQVASLVMTSALIVSACSSGAATPAAAQSAAPGQSAPAAAQSAAPGQSAPAAAGPTGTLTFADWELSEGSYGTNVEKVLKSYETSHPGTTIAFQTMSYDSYPSTLKTQIGAGGGPDIMVLLDQDFFALQKAGDLQPMTSLTPDEIGTLRPANKDAVVGSDRLGYIWETVIYGFQYNKSLFSQAGVSAAPTDFAGLLNDCKTIKAKTGKFGYAARSSINETEAWYEDYTGTWNIGYGGAWTDSSGKFTINSAANIQALTDYATLYNSGCYDTGVKASVFRPSFENGDVGILMDNANAGITYTSAGLTLSDQTMGSGPLPFPTKNSGMQQLYLTINKASKNAALAQSYVEWLLEPAQQQALVEVTAPQTTASTVIPSAAFNAAHPWASYYYGQADNGVTLLMAKRPELTNQLATTLMPFLAKVLAGQMSPTDALNAAQQAAVSAMSNP